MPIDERLEDLYAAAKQQQRWRESHKAGKVTAAQSEGRRVAKNRSSRMRGGIDQLLGCRDCTGRDNTSMIVVPDHMMNDTLSDSTSSTTV